MKTKIIGGKVYVVDANDKQLAGPFNTAQEARDYIASNGGGQSAIQPIKPTTPATPSTAKPSFDAVTRLAQKAATQFADTVEQVQGGTKSAAAQKAKTPARNSAADLLNRGALNVGGRRVLEGQQYIKQNEVVQAGDGQWFVVDPQGQSVAGPFPNQTQANAANVYSEVGPAITSNKYANIGNMAMAGANRPRISAGSGQDAVTSLDQMIQATNAKGTQMSDFVGAANIPGAGVADVGYGKIPDYGGMRGVLDAAGIPQSFTGRTIGPDGREIAIGMGAPVDQGSTGVGSQIWTMLAPYLSQSQINKIDPADYASITLALNSLREQNQIQQADTAATKSNQAENYRALTGDPYELDILPEPMAQGGSVMVNPDDIPLGYEDLLPRPRRPRGTGYRDINLDEVPLGYMDTVPSQALTVNRPGGGSTEGGTGWGVDTSHPLFRGGGGGGGYSPAPTPATPSDGVNASSLRSAGSGFGGLLGAASGLGGYTYHPAIPGGNGTAYVPGYYADRDGNRMPVPTWQSLGIRDRTTGRLRDPRDVPPPQNDIWRGLMGNSPNWFEGDNPYEQAAQENNGPERPRFRGGRQELSAMAQGGNIVTGDEPMTVVGQQTGNAYATIGEPNALTGGRPTREVLNVTPMEPSVPMPMQPPQPSAFALLMEQMFATNRKGRKPQYAMQGAR